MEMIAIYAPQTESEAAVITSLMDAYEIRHFIRGGQFSTMYPGAIPTSLNAQMLVVDAEQADLARQLLDTFFTESGQDPNPERR